MYNTRAAGQAMFAPEQLEALRKIDSPTIANAIEAFDVRDRTEGYASLELRCLFPDLPPIVGYAVTCTVDSTSPGKRPPTALHDLFAMVQAAPKPALVIMKHIGPDRLPGRHAGDVVAPV